MGTKSANVTLPKVQMLQTESPKTGMHQSPQEEGLWRVIPPCVKKSKMLHSGTSFDSRSTQENVTLLPMERLLSVDPGKAMPGSAEDSLQCQANLWEKVLRSCCRQCCVSSNTHSWVVACLGCLTTCGSCRVITCCTRTGLESGAFKLVSLDE